MILTAVKGKIGGVCHRQRTKTLSPLQRGGCGLLLAEGLAVGTLFLGGICLVGTHQNTLQRAEVRIVAVVCALMDGALNALICMAIHSFQASFSP